MSDAPVLVVPDHDAEGRLQAGALNLLAAARALGPVEVAWLGEAEVPLAELGAQGVARVLRVRPRADERLGAVRARALAAAVTASGAGDVLLTSTFENKEVAAHLAAALPAGIVTDAEDVTLEDGHVVAGKTELAGTWTARCTVTAPIAVVLLKASARAQDVLFAETEPQVVDVDVEPDARDTRVELVSRQERAGSDRPDLAGAAIVVVGGRGTEGDFGPVEDLADALGAAVGATRVVTDNGWQPHESMVGQTGTTISPRLYIGAGVSGAIHHRGGMQASGAIVAINADPDAPIFEFADLGIVGDLFQVLPQAAAELRRRRG